jgi:hypothetical protein
MAAEVDVQGLNKDLLDDCLVNPPERVVSEDVFEGKRLGVSSTFLIGHRTSDGSVRLATRIRGAFPFPVFQKALQEALDRPKIDSRVEAAQ